MTKSDPRLVRARAARLKAHALPISEIARQAENAMGTGDWLTATTLFGLVAKKAAIIFVHCTEKEIEVLSNELKGSK